MTNQARTARQTRAVFVHHSVGRQLIDSASIRSALLDEGIELTDVDYNKIGARGPAGTPLSAPPVPEDDTDIGAYVSLLTGDEQDGFLQWLRTFDIVVLKSCYPNSNIKSSDAEVRRRKEIETIVSHSAVLFRSAVWVTPPPLTRFRTTNSSAARAHAVAQWTVEMPRSPNVAVFNLHAELSEVDGGQRGMLREDFRRLPLDSHPNRLGAARAGASLAKAIIAAGRNTVA